MKNCSSGFTQCKCDYLFVTETWPTMLVRLNLELLECAAAWCDEQWFARDRVVEGDLYVWVCFAKETGLAPVATELSVVAIEAADAIGRVVVAVPTQVLHDWFVAGAVRFLTHDALVTLQWVLSFRVHGEVLTILSTVLLSHEEE